MTTRRNRNGNLGYPTTPGCQGLIHGDAKLPNSLVRQGPVVDVGFEIVEEHKRGTL